jgi:hypothetical protein
MSKEREGSEVNLDSPFRRCCFSGYIFLGGWRENFLVGDVFWCGFRKENVGELVG